MRVQSPTSQAQDHYVTQAITLYHHHPQHTQALSPPNRVHIHTLAVLQGRNNDLVFSDSSTPSLVERKDPASILRASPAPIPKVDSKDF
jgi:hypothetical protein